MLPPEFPSTDLPDTDRQRFEAYWERFVGQGSYGPGHFILTCYAAFPVVLTPDLLYKLWMNFGKYRNAEGRLVHIEQVAVADLLLAPFLTPLRGDIYRMSAPLRQACLRYLRDVRGGDNPMGLHSLEELAYFLLHYLQKYYVVETPSAAAFREAQEWSALAYLQPELAIHQLTEAFRDTAQRRGQEERLRLTLTLQQLVEQERSTKADGEEKAFEAFAAFSEGWKAYLEGNRIQATEQFRQAKGTLMTMPVPRPVHDALQEAPPPRESHLHLLLIAVDQYESEEVAHLQGSVNDARRLRSYLEAQYQVESTRELYDAAATLAEVTAALSEVIRRAGSRENVLIYFAGHGINRTGSGGDLPEAGLVLADYNASDHRGLLSEAAFAALIQESNLNDPAITLILDTDSGTQRWLDMRNDQHIILAASRRGQPSYEARSGAGPGGAFTSALIEELEKAGGIITYRRLFQLVQRNVRRRYRQNPQLFGSPRAVCRLFASARDSEVPRLQELLKASGYYQGPVDGHHGPQTAAALRQFRTAYQLDEKEDPLSALERKVLVQDARAVEVLFLGPPLPETLNRLPALLAELPKTNFLTLSGEDLQAEGQKSLDAPLDAAHILILGMDRDFLRADYAERVIAKAIEEAQVDSKILLPLLLEECEWVDTDLRDFPVLPRNRHPIYSDYWASPEEALETVLEEVAATVEGLERFLPKTAPAGKGTIYALFVGIDRYDRLPALRTCTHDADELAARLPALVSDRRWKTKTMLDQAAQGTAVRQQLETYVAEAREEDVVLFFFAGHGRNRLQGAAQNQLLFYDFDQSEPAAGSLSEDDFRLLVQQHARQDPTIVLILDTHAGRNGWLQPDRDNHLIIAGCTDEQYAVEGEAHGRFTGALLETLQHLGGRVTYRRLMREVRAQMRGTEQLPLLWATDNGAARPLLAAENEPALYLLEQLQAAGYYGEITGEENTDAATGALDRFRREWSIEQEEDILEALEQKALADRRETLQLLVLTGYEPNRVNTALSGLLDELTVPLYAERYRPGQRSARQAQSKFSSNIEAPAEADALERIDRADLIVLLIDDYFVQTTESAALVQRILYRQQTDYLPVVPILIQDCPWTSHPVAQLPGMELYRMKGNFLDREWIETTGMQPIREKIVGIGRFMRTPAQRALLESAGKYDPAMPLEAMETLVAELRGAAANLDDTRFLTEKLTIETPHSQLLATAVALQESPPSPEGLDALTSLLQAMIDGNRLTNYRRNLLFHLLLAFDRMIRRDNEQTPPTIDEERRRQLIELLLRFDQAQIEAFEKGDNDLSLLAFELVPQAAAPLNLTLANLWLTTGTAARAIRYRQLSPSDLALPEPEEAARHYLETCEQFDGEMPVGKMDQLGNELAGQASSIAHFHFLVDRLRPDLFQGYIFGAAKGIEAQPEAAYFGPLLGYLDRISQTQNLNYDNLRLRVLYRLLMGLEAILERDNVESTPAIDRKQREQASEVLQRIRATPRAAADAEKNKRGGIIRRIDRVLGLLSDSQLDARGSSSTEETAQTQESSFTDPRDGQTYQTVILGGLKWMSENMNFDTGDGCWHYNNDPENGNQFGRLYTFEAARDACPPGWRLPTDEEWKELFINFGGYLDEDERTTHGTPATTFDALTSGGPTGFNAAFGGIRKPNGEFLEIGQAGYYWSGTISRLQGAVRYGFGEKSKLVSRRSYRELRRGYSVRCVKDESTDESSQREMKFNLSRALFQLGFTSQLEAARKIDISPHVLPILMPGPPAAGPGLLRDRLIGEFALPPEYLVQLNINELAAYGFDERTFLQAVIDQLRLDSGPKLEEFAEALNADPSYSELVIYLEDHQSLPEAALRSFALAWLDVADRLARALREHPRAGGLRHLWLLLAVDKLPAGVPPEVSYNWYAEPVVLPAAERIGADEVATWAEQLPERERMLVLEKFLSDYQPGYPLEVIRELCRELEAEEVYDRYFREYEKPDAPS